MTENITVSRDALRAELAEMELRLIGKLVSRASFDSLTASHKQLSGIVAEKIAWAEGLMLLRDKLIAEHNVLMGEHERKVSGEFTRAQELALDNKIEAVLEGDHNNMWVYRRNWIAVCALLVSAATAILFALH